MQVDTQQFYLQEFDKFTESFVDTVVGFTQATFNTPLRDGGWSAAQHVEHLRLCEVQTLALLDSASVPVDGRRADEKCARIDSLYRVPKTPMQTRPDLDPPAEKYLLSESLERFVDLRAELRVAFSFADNIAAEIQAFPLGELGYLTLCEWFFFTAIHGERHRGALEG